MKMLMALAVAGVLMLVAGCSGEIVELAKDFVGRIPAPLTGLPSGHTLTSGTIPPGESRTILQSGGMRTTITCPSGGAACMVTVASNGTATYTGGRPAVVTAPIPGGGVIPPGLSVSRSAWERDFLANWPSINNWSAFQGVQPWIPSSEARSDTYYSNSVGSWRGTLDGTPVSGTVRFGLNGTNQRRPAGYPSGYYVDVTFYFYEYEGGRQVAIRPPFTPVRDNGTWDSRGNRLDEGHGAQRVDWGGALYSSRGANSPGSARGWIKGRQDYTSYDDPNNEADFVIRASTPTGTVEGVWETGLERYP